MTRHAKNCTAGTVYSYHERKKDSEKSGYGTLERRIGKDSVKDFDCCCLTLQPCREAVITPHGFLYDKEAILEYIIHQKKENIRKLKEYEKQKNKEKAELAEIGEAEHRAKVESFVAKEGSIISKPSNVFSADPPSTSGESVSNISGEQKKHLPSFWVPSLTPAAKKTIAKPPEKVVLCPMSGKPLKLKDLIPVKFTPINDPDDKKSLINKQARYMCAVTHDVLSNPVPCAVLRTSGVVVTMEAVEKLLRKDMLDPMNGTKMTEDDIIPMHRGGTGYSASGNKLDVKKPKPAMAVA